MNVNDDLDILARTLYGEAEVGDEDDAEAIASVVMNRVRYPNWPNTVRGVCLQPWQFSCWNEADPQRARIIAVKPGQPWFDRCRDIADRAISGRLVDRTNRATHYYATYIKPPKWAKGHEPSYVNTAGKYSHLFFNDIDTPPPASAKEALDQSRPLSSTRTVTAGGVAAIATAVGAAVEQISPAFPLLGTIAEHAPYVLALLALAAIGYMLWARYDDRRNGLR